LPRVNARLLFKKKNRLQIRSLQVVVAVTHPPYPSTEGKWCLRKLCRNAYRIDFIGFFDPVSASPQYVSANAIPQ